MNKTRQTKLQTPIYRIISTSKIYKNANSDKSPDEDFFGSYQIEYDNIERFEVIGPIGSGKYSLVFVGRYDGGRLCAIKTLKNVPFVKIQREIWLLKQVSTLPNCVHLISVVRDPLTSTISLITDYVKSENPRSLYPKLKLEEIRILIYRLLISLDSCAQKGIMHRDVKPGNLLISSDHQQLELIGWGLADLYFPGHAYTVRVSTLRYKAPELLLNYQYYDYGIDVWGVGCVLAEMLIKYPFFEGRNIDEMIIQVATLCGTTSLLQYVDKYGLNMPQTVSASLPPNRGPGWQKAINSIKQHKMDQDAVSLLKRLLTIDHEERITASEALQHPFFDPIRDEIKD
ncbi:Pkinase-domain-containing protein [Histomonas meleagridis]|nr:Pkinase-domain-containing protein [Histomonas meleagridis]